MPDRPFLERLPQAEKARLIAAMSIQSYSSDEIVIAQHDDSRDAFFVLEGMARVTIYSVEGKIVAFRDISAGDVFGELACIDDAPRAATVVAVENLRVGRLSQIRFREMVDTSTAFRWTLLSHLTAQARNMTERIFQFSTMFVRERLVEELIRIAEAEGAINGEATIRPAPTHFDLAARISTHREAVSREMSRLANRKLLSKKTGGLLVLDIDGLRALREPAGGNKPTAQSPATAPTEGEG